MPTRTIWVREDDLEDFDNIKDRPEWLHRAIEHEKELMRSTQLPAGGEVPEPQYTDDDEPTFVSEDEMP